MNRAHLVRAVIVALAALPCWAIAQEDGPTSVYVSVDCMKSTAADYEQVEKDIWLPMHQHMVDEGKRGSWALYRVMYGDRSRCDYYTVTTYHGEDQLDAETDYGAVFESVHGRKAMADAMSKTLASREQVSTELWLLVDQTDIEAHRYAIVNRMHAEDPVAYESMESRVFKAGHQALIDSGHRAGWAVYSLVSPLGTSIPYNYGTVDFVNTLGPAPMADAMLAGNPDRDLDAMHELLELREHVLSETWALVVGTNPVTK